MKYPVFFDSIETIKLQDDLSNFLGTFENGIVEFSYLDVVKMAGHSCPTVAGAYIMILVGLKELYCNELPKRGEIFVSFKEDSSEGIVGVIANIMTQITGATEVMGFKGVNGQFKRFNLMKFNDNISSSVKFKRIDNGKTVELIYDSSFIKADPIVSTLMKKILDHQATQDEKIKFGQLWQKRVEEIFSNIDKVIKII